MTDITGNFGVNTRNNEYANTKHVCADTKCCHNEEDTVNEKTTDLNESPAYVSGRAMVKPSSIKTSDYKFDPKNIEDDVADFNEKFNEAFAVATEMKNGLVAQGYDEKTAQEMAAKFVACLMVPSD